MDLKSIEMQIALPRTHEAGKIQEQLQQRGQLLQDEAAKMVLQEEIKKRNSVIKSEKTVLSNGENEKRKPINRKTKDKKQSKNAHQKEVHHPYKGTKIDFSG